MNPVMLDLSGTSQYEHNIFVGQGKTEETGRKNFVCVFVHRHTDIMLFCDKMS
jgi:hypothetical protein